MSKHLVHKASEQRVKGIIISAVRMEQRFLDAFAVKLTEMNCFLMKPHTESMAALLLLGLDFNRVFRVENPFGFTENTSREGKSNFFGKKAGDSQGMGGRLSTTENSFTLDADF